MWLRLSFHQTQFHLEICMAACRVCKKAFYAQRSDAQTCGPRCRRKLSRHPTWYPAVTLNKPDHALKSREGTQVAKPERRAKDAPKIRAKSIGYEPPKTAKCDKVARLHSVIPDPKWPGMF